MPIPATCTVPAGEYDSYVPFEERVLSKAYIGFALAGFADYRRADIFRSTSEVKAGDPNPYCEGCEFEAVYVIPEYTMVGRDAVNIDTENTHRASFDQSDFQAVGMFRLGVAMTSNDEPVTNVYTSKSVPWAGEEFVTHVALCTVHDTIHPSTMNNFFSKFGYNNNKTDGCTFNVNEGGFIDTSQVTDFTNAFSFINLIHHTESAFFSMFDFSKAEKLDHTFRGLIAHNDENRTAILSKVLTEIRNLSTFSYMFAHSDLLADNTVPNFNVWNPADYIAGDYAFYNMLTMPVAIAMQNIKLVGQSLFAGSPASRIVLENVQLTGPFTTMFSNSNSAALSLLNVTADDSNTGLCSGMFANTKFKTLNISFLPAVLTNTSRMFYNCPNLTTILSDKDFDSNRSNTTFVRCPNLVGGAGTSFAESQNQSGEYLRIDNPPDAPGYLTSAN